MMPLSLFGSASFVGLTLFTLLLYGALGGLFVLVPYVLIQAGGYTATQAGAALLPLPLAIAVASPAAGAFAAMVGPRWLLITAPAIVAAGFLLAVRIGSDTSYWLGVFPAMVVIALGMAAAVAPLTTAVLMSVDSIRSEQRSGAYWRIGCYSPYRTCDSVIRTCVAFSFWSRCSDGRSRLLGSSGQRFYLDRPARKNQPSVER
jgi:predicted MFS family arabinose efflux permease